VRPQVSPAKLERVADTILEQRPHLDALGFDDRERSHVDHRIRLLNAKLQIGDRVLRREARIDERAVTRLQQHVAAAFKRALDGAAQLRVHPEICRRH
jgi:hypothetical protein